MRQLALLVSKMENNSFHRHLLTLGLIMPAVSLFQLRQLQQASSRVIVTIALAAHNTFATYARLLRGGMNHMRRLAISASEALSQAIATITLADHTSFVTHAR